MAKNKGKSQTINNIGELNLEIDYDKLAEAIVRARAIELEDEEKRRVKKQEEWRNTIGLKNHEDKTGIIRALFVVCNRIKAIFYILFFPKKKTLGVSAIGLVSQNILAVFFNTIKIFLWLFSLIFFSQFLFSIFSNWGIVIAINSFSLFVSSFILAQIFRLMAIETEQMTDRERVLSVFSAVMTVIPLIEKVSSFLNEVVK